MANIVRGKSTVGSIIRIAIIGVIIIGGIVIAGNIFAATAVPVSVVAPPNVSCVVQPQLEAEVVGVVDGGWCGEVVPETVSVRPLVQPANVRDVVSSVVGPRANSVSVNQPVSVVAV